MKKDLLDEERIKISQTWFNHDTADYWRHKRSYNFLQCIEDKSLSWLTVGDGRWGLDSIRIREKGFVDVLPTDISEALLQESQKRGHITKYAVENAEKLSFHNDSFDYVFCKESFHHFPRPYIALYEMLRVARRGVFLIEPNDGNINMANYVPTWETCGNFVYTFSRIEACKVALGVNMPQLLFSGLNDHYVKGVEFEPANVRRSQIFRDVVETVLQKDERCRKGEADYDILMVGFLKHPLLPNEAEEFRKQNWQVINLPRNPHVA